MNLKRDLKEKYNKMNKQVIVLTGPTASGKTELAVYIAQKIKGEIVSADSMQIYNEMSIGTAKPTAEEMLGIPHYMINEVSIQTPYSVALYQKKAFEHIENILKKGLTPIVAGGTGLYINSLLYKLDFTHTIKDETYRKELDQRSLPELYACLLEQDKAAAGRIHPNDRKRITRRLEIIKNGGASPYNFREINNDYNFLCIGITMERNELYKRIENRVDKMFREGLVEEVTDLYHKYPVQLSELKAIGYKEIIAYLRGNCTLLDASAEIKKNTRRFAKRQLTWFNNDDRIKWFSLSKYIGSQQLKEAVIQYVIQSEKVV
jgi:tRNA dimethylallyltransferase